MQPLWSRNATLAYAVAFLSSTALAVPSINEIRIDQPSADDDEYFELAGAANESLDGLTYIVIGDGAGGSGVIEAIVDLAGQTIPADGFFLAAEGTFSLGTPDLTTDLAFENSDNVTHLLVSDFTGTDQQDLDTDDDGTLDVTPWTAIVDSVALVETVGSGDLIYSTTTVGPDGTFVPGHAFRMTDGDGTWQIGDFGAGVDDSPGASNEGGGGGGIGECGDPAELISAIQGSGDTSPLEGQDVVAEAIVVGDFQSTETGLRGFFLMEAVADRDADPLTSEGVFVFDNGLGVDVAVGELVRVGGNVNEFFGLTEISQVSDVIVCETTDGLDPIGITLPEETDGDLEAYEGMLVEITHDMIVSQNFFLGRYGQMTLASPDDNGDLARLFNPTNQFEPLSTEAIALADENARRLLVLDDGYDISSFGDNPDPVPYIGPPPPDVIRAGDRVQGLIGVIDYGRINSGQGDSTIRDYRLHPTVAPTFVADNPRTDEPDAVSGELKVASFNVLNYFTTIDNGDPICGPLQDQGCRGADSAEEFTRQRDKIIIAINAIDADIVGLIEIENNPSASLADLVAGLNAARGSADYAFVNTGTIGGDAIKVGFIYKPATVDPARFAILDEDVDPRARTDFNRPALAVTFDQLSNNERFTAIVNHFKSKGSPCDAIGDPDTGDGQGNCNLTRVGIAEAMIDWLATDPTSSGDPDYLVMGDLNAYAKEDPIQVYLNAGYVDTIARFVGDTAYSFTFDGAAGYLDHALANPSLTSQVVGATEWHINTDEPAVLDYNVEFNPAGYYNADAFRASDHDPLVIGLDLGEVEPLRGDVDGDGDIDLRDRRLLKRSLGSEIGDPDYLPSADLNDNGVINQRDLRIWWRLYLGSLLGS